MKQPKWINKKEYPFDSHYFKTPVGKMHYVDEGEGDPIVMVHGNPAWSFMYRGLIKEFSKTHRCISCDHIGFGLSDKPLDWSYLPKDHAKNFDMFMESLDLKNITLVVVDWGGPIGMSYAVNHPKRIKNLVVNNTWFWSVKGNWYYEMFSGVVGGPFGKFMIKKRNMFVRDVMPAAYGDKRKLTPEVMKHYFKPMEKVEERIGCWMFPREVVGSHQWLGSQWKKIKKIKKKNVLIAWGMKDIAFKQKEMNTWKAVFPQARVVTYKDAGHFVAEEKSKELAKEMRKTFS